MKKIINPLIIFLLIISFNSEAQFYVTGTDNPATKLKEIQSSHFNVVFPKEYETEGLRLAFILEKTYNMVSNSLGHKVQRKIPVLLRTGNTNSNAFVTWAPRRSEINYIPPQRSYSQNWLEHVVIHEARHMVQLDKMENGIHKIFRIIFGEAAIALVAGQYPLWAYEGDAVVTETALTNTGRGRSPSFLMGLKAILLENESSFSYEKAYYGSFHDFVPSYYVYGYTMSAIARVKYDSMFWQNILDYIPKKPYLLYPSYFGMKKKYNLSKQKLYQEAITYFRKDWQKTNLNTNTSPVYNKLKKEEYTSYLYPVITEDENVICLKKRNSYVDQFVELNKSGDEKILIKPGIHNIDRLSYGGGKLVWSEIRPNPRWEQEEKSVIRIYDIHSEKNETIGTDSKYVVPAINPQGDKIVAVETGLPGYDNLVVFNVKTKKKEKVFKMEGVQIQIPSWHSTENKIVYTKITAKGKYIEEMDLSTGSCNEVFGPFSSDLLSPSYMHNKILFSSSFNGTDNLFALEPESRSLYLLTNSKYGTFDPVYEAKKDRLYFNEYSSLGYNVAFMNLKEKKITSYNTDSIFEPGIVELLSKQEVLKFSSEKENVVSYEIKDYKRWKHIFNMHSWLPLYAEPNPSDIFNGGIYPGLTAFTQNLTGTLYGWAGYSYRQGEHFGNVNLTYKGLWPVLSLDYEIGGKPGIVEIDESTTKPEINYANRQQIQLTSYVPLLFYKGSGIIRLQPRVDLIYNDIYFENQEKGIYEKGFTNLQYSMYFYAYSKMARKDIYPRIGLYGLGKYYHTPFENYFGDMYNLNTRIFLPGFFQNHSLRIAASYQHQNSGQIRYLYSLPRGYNTVRSNQMSVLSFDYALPLIYPDWKLGPISYIKRFKANMFYDRAFVQGIDSGENPNQYIDEFYQSMGLEVTADMHIAHVLFPVSLGGRVVYVPKTGKTIIQPVLSFNLGDF